MLFRKRNTKDVKRLPILIVPGFMSSGLQVEESNLREAWVGKRIWLNLGSLGFESMGRKKNAKPGSVRNFQKTTANQEDENEIEDGEEAEPIAVDPELPNATTPSENDIETGEAEEQQQEEKIVVDEELHRKGAVLRNAWLQHMALQDDLVSERQGIRVRPIEGLSGVDYLAPGLFTSHVSYVFGPVIQTLLKTGYKRRQNLDAAPYDWRLPPSMLETRDQYFTRTMEQIEQLYHTNQSTPVVLVCHSMGCKIAHYLLNFAKQTRGQEWIDRYIHTYIPVGAPHIGAPKALRSLISGDKMGLDTFLTDTDARTLGRSLGSGPFLLPTRIPQGATASAFLRMDGAIEVSVTGTIDVELFLNRREADHRPDKLKLTVVFGGRALSTPFHHIDEESQQVRFEETFTFRTKADGPLKKQRIAFLLCEPGATAARKSRTEVRRKHLKCRACIFRPWKINCGGQEAKWGRPPKDNKALYWINIIFFWWLIYPLLRYSIELCLKIFLWSCYGLFLCLYSGTIISIDELSKVSGGSSLLAVAKLERVRKAITSEKEKHSAQKPNEIEVELDLVSARDKQRCCACCFDKRKNTMTVKVKWIPPQSTYQPRSIHRKMICQPNSSSRPVHGHFATKKGKKKYSVRSGYDILYAENLFRVLEHMEEVYDKDNLDPRGASSVSRPPVQAIKAIYGINVSTEVGAVYKRRVAVLGNTEQVDNYLKPDKEAVLKGNNGDHIINNGTIYECGSETRKTGDGTVPYWSLAYVRQWEAECDLTVHELDGAEHRGILADKRLHKILVDYCCQKDSVVDENNMVER